jgi:type VI secretion system protein ImpH
MTVVKPDRRTAKLEDLLELDPGRFEPTTAFRVAEQLSGGELSIAAHRGVGPAPIPVSGLVRDENGLAISSSIAGLTGPLGSLPPAYNELVMREERNRSRGLGSFLDLFNARMTELFVAANEKYRIARRLRWSDVQGKNSFVTSLLALAGFGTKRLVERSGVEPDIILRFNGFFSARTRNAANLRAMLCEFTGLPVEIEQFRARWLTIAVAERSQLGGVRDVQLGVNATAGTAIHDFSGGFRVVLGPLDYEAYLTLSAGSKAMNEIFALTRLYAGTGLDFDVQVVLKKDAIPFCRLGEDGDPPRLGWNTWARIAPAKHDSTDAIVTQQVPQIGKAAEGGR